MSEAPISIFSKQPDRRERRNDSRKKSLLPAVLVTEAGSFECRIHDLSSGGARVESETKVYRDQPVILIVGSNRARGGSVAWCDEGCFGISFSKQSEEPAIDHPASEAAASVEHRGRAAERPMTFVEFKRFQGSAVFVNPAQVLYLTSQGDGRFCEIHFGNDAQVTVLGDCKRVCSQLTRS